MCVFVGGGGGGGGEKGTWSGEIYLLGMDSSTSKSVLLKYLRGNDCQDGVSVFPTLSCDGGGGHMTWCCVDNTPPTPLTAAV